MTSGSANTKTSTHYTVGACIGDYIENVMPRLEGDDFEAAWTALGILLNLAVFRPKQPEPSVLDEIDIRLSSLEDTQQAQDAELTALSERSKEEGPGEAVVAVSFPAEDRPLLESAGLIPKENGSAAPIIGADGRHDCWLCGKVFAKHHGLAIHMGQVHETEQITATREEKASPEKPPAAEELWRRSHAPGLPYPKAADS